MWLNFRILVILKGDFVLFWFDWILCNIVVFVCGGFGFVCFVGVYIECVVGGIVGCICFLVYIC